MEINDVIAQLAGNSPFAGFLIWYIITERKVKKDEKVETGSREDKLLEILLKNHEVIRATQDIMLMLSNKYDELNVTVIEGFAETNVEMKNIYKICSK